MEALPRPLPSLFSSNEWAGVYREERLYGDNGWRERRVMRRRSLHSLSSSLVSPPCPVWPSVLAARMGLPCLLVELHGGGVEGLGHERVQRLAPLHELLDVGVHDVFHLVQLRLAGR